MRELQLHVIDELPNMFAECLWSPPSRLHKGNDIAACGRYCGPFFQRYCMLLSLVTRAAGAVLLCSSGSECRVQASPQGCIAKQKACSIVPEHSSRQLLQDITMRVPLRVSSSTSMSATDRCILTLDYMIAGVVCQELVQLTWRA